MFLRRYKLGHEYPQSIGTMVVDMTAPIVEKKGQCHTREIRFRCRPPKLVGQTLRLCASPLFTMVMSPVRDEDQFILYDDVSERINWRDYERNRENPWLGSLTHPLWYGGINDGGRFLLPLYDISRETVLEAFTSKGGAGIGDCLMPDDIRQAGAEHGRPVTSQGFIYAVHLGHSTFRPAKLYRRRVNWTIGRWRHRFIGRQFRGLFYDGVLRSNAFAPLTLDGMNLIAASPYVFPPPPTPMVYVSHGGIH